MERCRCVSFAASRCGIATPAVLYEGSILRRAGGQPAPDGRKTDECERPYMFPVGLFAGKLLIRLRGVAWHCFGFDCSPPLDLAAVLLFLTAFLVSSSSRVFIAPLLHRHSFVRRAVRGGCPSSSSFSYRCKPHTAAVSAGFVCSFVESLLLTFCQDGLAGPSLSAAMVGAVSRKSVWEEDQ